MSDFATPTELRIDVDLDLDDYLIRMPEEMRDFLAKVADLYRDTQEIIEHAYRCGLNLTRRQALHRLRCRDFIAALMALVACWIVLNRWLARRPEGSTLSLRWLDELTRLAATLTAAPAAPPAALAVR